MIKYKKQPKKRAAEIYHELHPNSNKEIKQITFQVTEDCCLKCTYCYQLHKTNNKMEFNTIKIFVDNLLNNQYEAFTTENTAGIIFDFIGGEPLMEIDLIEQACEYIVSQMFNLKHPWLYNSMFTIDSNGILYTNEKVQNFFKKYHNVLGFGISIDGNKELHDKCRLDLFGQGSYDRAINAVHLHQKNFNIIPETKMTLSPENIIHTKDAVINLINEGYVDIFFNCQYEPVWNIQHARILYNELISLADYIIDNHLYDKIYISMFDEEQCQPLAENHDENWCGGTTDNMMALDYQGKFYPCIRYMESSLNGAQAPIIIGDIENGYLKSEKTILNHKKLENVTRKSQSPKECLNCKINAGCSWCSAYNYQETGSVNKRLTYICIMHKARALANVYYWNKLYKILGINKEFINFVSPEDINNIIV